MAEGEFSAIYQHQLPRHPLTRTALTQNTHILCADNSNGLDLQCGSNSENRLGDLEDAFVLVHGAFA